MTPERAKEILRGNYTKWTSPLTAILVACAEERRAALTEAAEACRKERDAVWNAIKTRNSACEACAAAIERIRDKK